MSKASQQPLASGNTHIAPHPWGRAGIWLIFLAPFFFISYNLANGLASESENISYVVFDWERHIPFIPWTIIPYWIIDILYGISLFICVTRKELDRHALRLLTAQVVAVICFIIFPLGFTFERPETTGAVGWLFTKLSDFDQPYNQAPSLHITLLVILWTLFAYHLPRRWIWPLHITCVLIGVSVLTTYQHHFIDIPTGALLGFICVWWWPLEGKTMHHTAKWTNEPRRWKIAAYYLLGSMVAGLLAFGFGGMALWLLWPTVSLLLVALNYVYFGSAGFQKEANGEMSMAAKWLYFPYLVGAYINSRLWTRNEPKAVLISDGLYLGRLPSGEDIKIHEYDAVIEMTAEFDKTYDGIAWHAIPSLDLLVPSKDDLIKASRLISQWQQKGNVLVACALGYSRSALAIMAWLLLTKRSESVDDAIERVREQRPNIVINDEARTTLEDLIKDNA